VKRESLLKVISHGLEKTEARKAGDLESEGIQAGSIAGHQAEDIQNCLPDTIGTQEIQNTSMDMEKSAALQYSRGFCRGVCHHRTIRLSDIYQSAGGI
jgi:hypothetical protein